jgi:hypothetical protein
MFQFWPERGGDKTVLPEDEAEAVSRLGSMGRKHDMTRWHHNVDWRRGDTGEGKRVRR